MTAAPPRLAYVRKHAGTAGQFEVSASYAYPGEEWHRISFVGSVYGGPVVMIGESGDQMFVRDPDRFGKFGTDWVERFLGADS